ncbi:MAG: AAA family ATPase [Thermoplasmata archaeon]|nr:AAA family ATPase [Thermoplasmata archaeon]
MKLISIELHNFRKFQHAEINFPNGIIGIIGSNGAGKSTIIEAIGWAIYGNKASRTQKDQIKRQGAAASDDCWVRLRFEMNGNSYEILRILKANFSDAQAKVNDGIAATTSTGVTKFLEKKIGMNYDSFYTSIVAKQKELNALSNKTPADRKKNMFKMLKIDAIEDAIKRVREDKREKNSVIQHIEKVLKDVDEIIKEKIRKEAEKENLLISAKKIDEEISEKEKILFEVEEER